MVQKIILTGIVKDDRLNTMLEGELELVHMKNGEPMGYYTVILTRCDQGLRIIFFKTEDWFTYKMGLARGEQPENLRSKAMLWGIVDEIKAEIHLKGMTLPFISVNSNKPLTEYVFGTWIEPEWTAGFGLVIPDAYKPIEPRDTIERETKRAEKERFLAERNQGT